MSKTNKVQVETDTETVVPTTEVVVETVTESTVEEPKVLTDKDYYGKYGNISQTIRGMSAEGMTKGQIAKILGKRYQHVRNVLIQPLKKEG